MCDRFCRFSVSLLLFLLLAMFHVAGLAKDASERPEAIDFPKDIAWLNVSRPLSLDDLRGRVVILDFWTYGCINCMHVLKDLRRLEEKYGDDLVVIGVHTPKFDNEKNIDTLRRIIVRYGIEHPVANDRESVLAALYGMRAWPTQYVIDAEGRVLGKVEGEGNFDVLDRVVGELLAEREGDGPAARLPLKPEKAFFAGSLLAAPGKVAVGDGRVAVADTLHNRIIVAGTDGKIVRIVGSGKAGLVDGAPDKARFDVPQGLAFGDGVLYVADTGNHAIRRIDLADGSVKTIAGNGRMASHAPAIFEATSTGLRSPWALARQGNRLYIAMAGDHRIWRLDLDQGKIRPWAGDGRESIEDGEIRAASFSQPSGLALHKGQLYVADAEVSAVRRIDIEKERVETLVGKGLFDFGDVDGGFDSARLQHVLGIAVRNDDELYVADTYNHKLKRLYLNNRRVETVAGTGKPGRGSGRALEAALNEPGGLAVLDGDILIADTNNNRIMRYDPEKRELSEWVLRK